MNLQELKESLLLPVIAAPMFIVSGTEMVIESCKKGIVGAFPALNGRTSEDFEKMLVTVISELKKFEEETGQKPAPFGVNLIVHRSNRRLETDTALCVKHKVPLVITSLGAVKEIVDTLHYAGSLVFHDVIKKRHAEKATEAGVDGIICVSTGAGGHAGRAHPFALISEIRKFYDGALVLAGSINTGAEILAAQLAGADFAYMGTRFIATEECRAVQAYKNLIVASEIEDVIYTDSVSGVHANFLFKTLQKAGIDPNEKKEINLSRMAEHEAKAWKDIWSVGHGVTEIYDIPKVSVLVDRLKKEYKEALQMTADLANNLKF